jgi:phosphoribosylglycinamide formyltransferase 1
VLRLCALISGSGTTLQNFLDRTRDGRLRAAVAGVVSSRADVAGVEKARAAGVPLLVVDRKPSADFSERVFAAASQFRPDLILLCGWLHLLSVPEEFRGRVLNIHPSLLPKFGGKGMYGRHVHEAVLNAGESESGCTVHYADNSYDTGPILAQARVPVLATDTPELLAARVFRAECELYPAAVKIAGGA